MASKYPFKLRFNKKAISKWARRHPSEENVKAVSELPPIIKSKGFYSKEELQEFCYWKSPRTQSRVAQNPADYVEAITRVALSTPNERLRIEVLRLLHGVNWPSASVLLHFGHQEPYPILDFRALWSLGIDNRQFTYNFDLWWEYTQFCRKLAQETGLSMRELDRALWQYSKRNQKVLIKSSFLGASY